MLLLLHALEALLRDGLTVSFWEPPLPYAVVRQHAAADAGATALLRVRVALFAAGGVCDVVFGSMGGCA